MRFSVTAVIEKYRLVTEQDSKTTLNIKFGNANSKPNFGI
jgi:hypothetical protein